MKKQQSQRIHSKKRVSERYGFFFNKEIRRAIIKKIQNGETEALLRQSNTRSIHKVFIPVGMIKGVLSVPVETDNTVKMYIVYDKTRREIATVLPWRSDDTHYVTGNRKTGREGKAW